MHLDLYLQLLLHQREIPVDIACMISEKDFFFLSFFSIISYFFLSFSLSSFIFFFRVTCQVSITFEVFQFLSFLYKRILVLLECGSDEKVMLSGQQNYPYDSDGSDHDNDNYGILRNNDIGNYNCNDNGDDDKMMIKLIVIIKIILIIITMLMIGMTISLSFFSLPVLFL